MCTGQESMMTLKKIVSEYPMCKKDQNTEKRNDHIAQGPIPTIASYWT